MKKWMDNNNMIWEGKLAGVYATAGHLGGGVEIAEMTLIGHLLVKGAMVYSAGFKMGEPFTHYGTAVFNKENEKQLQRASEFGKRIAKRTKSIFKKYLDPI